RDRARKSQPAKSAVFAVEEPRTIARACRSKRSAVIERDDDLLAELEQRVVRRGRGARIDDDRAADLVPAARLVDVSAQDDVGLLALDERPHRAAADVLAAPKPVACGPEGRRVRAEDLQP